MKVNNVNRVASFPSAFAAAAPGRQAAPARPDYAAAFARNWKNPSAGKLDSKMKDLEARDKMGNFEIQRLMSQYNQAETLASSVRKKTDDTTNAVVGKI
ncbi:MAG: hypothetical protein ACKV22_25205 [Bryobacteraceae bacterium]